MTVTKELIERYFSVDDVIASGGGRSYYRLTKILDDLVRIQPIKSPTSSRLRYNKLSIVIDNFDAIDPNRIEVTVGDVLTANGLQDTQNESYLYGMAKEFFVRQNQHSILYVQDEFDKELEKAKNATPSERREGINKYPKTPNKLFVTSTQFQRNPYIVIEVLERANGICEACNSLAPFMRAKDNTPYLEVHHIDHLANGGEDTAENAQALCPNCHRERHFGIDS